ncbi:MAG: hypothetical protein ACKVQR_07505 [Aquabacterium sp.]
MTCHLLISLFALAITLVLPTPSHAGALRGSIPIVVLLCEPTDGQTFTHTDWGPNPLPRPTAQLLKQRLVDRGSSGIADFVHDWSNGLVDMDAARVYGWHTLPMTRAQWQADGPRAVPTKCLDHVRRHDPAWQANPPVDPIVIVVGYPRMDLRGFGRGLAILPEDAQMAEAMHEIGHALGLGHAHAERISNGQITWINERGDAWTVMAAMTAIYPVPTGFGNGPAGLGAPELQALGWLPATRMVTHGADGARVARYCLAPLNQPELPGWLAVRVQLSETDPLEGLVIEYRNRHGWGRGVDPTVGPRVLIHKVARSGDQQRVSLLYDRTHFTGPWIPAADVALASGVRVRVLATDRAGCGASVEVDQGAALTPQQRDWRRGTLGPLACRSVGTTPLVPRLLDPFDHVCTTPAIRDAHQAEGSGWRRGHAPSASTFCPAGLVFREAFKHDYTCVSPISRQQAQTDNAAASRNWVLP